MSVCLCVCLCVCVSSCLCRAVFRNFSADFNQTSGASPPLAAARSARPFCAASRRLCHSARSPLSIHIFFSLPKPHRVRGHCSQRNVTDGRTERQKCSLKWYRKLCKYYVNCLLFVDAKLRKTIYKVEIMIKEVAFSMMRSLITSVLDILI